MTTTLFKLRLLPLLAIAMTGSACTLMPDYQRPSAPLAAAYTLDDSKASETVAADIGWREFFTDPVLQQLITTALQNNRDLREAALNVEAARAAYRIQRSGSFPAVDVNGSQQVTKYPAGVSGSQAGSATSSDTINRYYSLGVGITAYEVDVFGRIQSLNKARLAEFLALEETRRSTQISLVAEVANAYFALLADQRLLEVTRSTLESQQSSLDITQKRLDAGVTNALTIRQVETSVFTAKANLARYTRQLQQDRNALALLLGTSTMPVEMPADGGLDEATLTIPLTSGLPSDLLTRRPDVLAAEHELIAANANIGAARAAFFPRVTLTGSYGTASSELDDLFSNGSETWSFAPQISIPIFSGGANQANLDLAQVQKDIRIARYEGTIQRAFREVADTLAARATLDDELGAQEGLVTASADSLSLSTLRFERGSDSYLAVLDSQRSLYGAQQSLETLKLARLQNLVGLYKALGGGWKERGSDTAPPQ